MYCGEDHYGETSGKTGYIINNGSGEVKANGYMRINLAFESGNHTLRVKVVNSVVNEISWED